MAQPLIKYLKRARPFPLAAIIEARPHQVASMNLWRSGADYVAVFAFDAGEGISREVLEEDRLYIAVEGDMIVETDGKRGALRVGECLYVPARTEHSLDALVPGKVLIVTVG